MRRVFLAAAVVMMGIGLASTPARAAAPRDQGWWTVTNPGGLPAAPPAPPDVPANGLLIQGGPNGQTAFAAVLYELDPGSTAGKLTLAIAPNTLTTPSTTLQLCQLLQPINHPEQGGPMADAPPFNCGRKVSAAPSAGGKSYEFDASGLVADGLVAVAILPMNPTDRVVLSPPDANSLTMQTGPSDTSAPLPENSGVTSPDTAPLPDTAGGLQGAGTSPSFTESVPGAVAGPTSVSPSPAATPAPSGTAGGFVPAVSSRSEKVTPVLVVLFILAGLGGAALWLYAGRPREAAVVNG